jgi:signal transduction histidine kinase
VIRNVARALWAEPRVVHRPARVWRDWVLVAAVVALAILETTLRRDLPWRAVGLLDVLVLALVLLVRRSHPLAAVAVGFGVTIAIDVASIVADTPGSVTLNTMFFLLVPVYALYRWGSGRDALIGTAIAFVAAGVSFIREPASVSDGAVGLVVLVFPGVLGASVRLWSTSRLRELDQVRLREREQLARELHDTVAHHVSAMVIRAQAGRVVATSNPAEAIDALRVIEKEGSRTLAEMRTMVGALRDREDADLAPGNGVADIERLARNVDGEPRVQVRLMGDLDGLVPAVGSATYRIAQESVTNALRHARNATRIDVQVVGDDDVVRLTVRDDGDAVNASSVAAGYGVVGMTERAALLGGTLEAGPGPHGWVVDGVLPRARRIP